MGSTLASTRVLALATGLALLLSGCSGTSGTDDPPTIGTETTTPAAEPPSPTGASATVELAFQRPDPLCPPASALEVAAPAGDQPHVLTDPHLSDTELERNDRYHVWCTYDHVDTAENGEDMVLADHVVITSETMLFRTEEEARWRDSDPVFPLESDDLDDWRGAIVSSRDNGIWWEGCGPNERCQGGERPTVRTRAWQTRFEGYAGNLEFYVHVTYVAERLPVDAEARTLEIFRSLVLATLENYERID